MFTLDSEFSRVIFLLTGVYLPFSPTELIIIITKMLMTGALSVVEPGSPIQLVLATLVMLTFTLITLKLAPYRHKSDDWITFLVSLVITGNTLAGFVLLMDKDNVPHNFNPKNVEVLLLIMNITVLIVQVLNMILMKWGLCNTMLSQPWCRKIQGACATCGCINYDLVEKEPSLMKTSSNKVSPTLHNDSVIASENTEERDNDEEVTLKLHRSEFERIFETGTIDKEVLQRMRFDLFWQDSHTADPATK